MIELQYRCRRCGKEFSRYPRCQLDNTVEVMKHSLRGMLSIGYAVHLHECSSERLDSGGVIDRIGLGDLIGCDKINPKRKDL